MADQPDVLPDPPAPAGVQQDAEPVQNLPQESVPIAEPSPAPGSADEVDFFLLVRSMRGLVLLRFRCGFSAYPG